MVEMVIAICEIVGAGAAITIGLTLVGIALHKIEV